LGASSGRYRFNGVSTLCSAQQPVISADVTAAFENRFNSWGSASTPLTSIAEGSVKQPENVQAPSGTSRIFQILTAAAWPLAVVLALHRPVITAFNGRATDGLTAVDDALSRALTGLPVYDQAYHHVDPRYLYTPGATLLLLPMGLVDNFDAVRYAFLIVNSVAIIVALALLTRLVGQSLRGPVWPVAITIGFSTVSVFNTLNLSFLHCILLMLISLYLFILF